MTSKKTRAVRRFKEFPKVEARRGVTYGTKIEAGLFASVPLARGERAFIARGRVIPLKVTSDEESALLPNAIGLSKERWLDPHPSNPLCYLNHSCEPNLGIRGARIFVALRAIEAGEHLTIDYSVTECDPLWTLDASCGCKAKACRTTIRAIQFLPKQVYRKYLPYIPTYFKRVYERMRY